MGSNPTPSANRLKCYVYIVCRYACTVTFKHNKPPPEAGWMQPARPAPSEPTRLPGLAPHTSASGGNAAAASIFIPDLQISSHSRVFSQPNGQLRGAPRHYWARKSNLSQTGIDACLNRDRQQYHFRGGGAAAARDSRMDQAIRAVDRTGPARKCFSILRPLR